MATGGSLFGNTNPPGGSSSLFGNLGSKSAQATGGGLFGNLSGSTATTAQTQPGQSATSNLFGGSTLGGSTFGGSTLGGSTLGGSTLGGSSNTQTTGGGLFGNLGGNQPQQNTNAGGIGGLGQSTQNQQQSNNPAASQGPVQQSTNGQNQNHAYFDSILEKSRKRAYGESGAAEDLPALQLGIGDIRQRIKRLGTGAGPDRSVDGKAHYLLAASGVDPGAAVRDLNLFSAGTRKVERLSAQQPVDTDVEGYLANIQTQTTLSMISDGLARSVRDFDAFLEDNVTMEWDAQRKKIYQHFGIKPREDLPSGPGRASFRESAPPDVGSGGFGRSRKSKAAAMASSRGPGPAGMSTFGRSSMARSAIGAAASAGKASQQVFTDVEKQIEKNGVTSTPGERFQRDKQNKYAEKIQELNLSRLQQQAHFYPICQELSSVVTQAGEQHGLDLAKAYRALADIVKEDPAVEKVSDPKAVKERSLAKAYLDENPNSEAGRNIRKQILRGGTKCLENLAFEEVESVIAKNPREANLGGIPNVISKVKAYVRLLALKKRLAGDNSGLTLVEEDYVWAVIYYLLRTGHIDEIVGYMNLPENIAAFRTIDRNFSAYITAYSNSEDRRLDRQLHDRINNEYVQRLRNAPPDTIDPYRMACYKIVGRCDLKSRNLEGVNHTVEDFVWLQLVLAREASRTDEISTEAYTLADLQKTMKEIGNRFFEKGGAEVGCSFGTFVFFQVACGMFEQAVAYLYPFSYTDAIHLAIATDFYGLLRVSDPNTAGEDLLSWTTRENPQLNFARMMGYYTRDFRAANVAAAVDYLVLIALNYNSSDTNTRNQLSLCHDALRELVLESREFALLLGDIRESGERQKGLIEERIGLLHISESDGFMRTITIQAASAADDNGRITDAVLLYHLADETDNVMTILNRSCGEYLAVPIGQEPFKLEPLKVNSQPDQESMQKGSLSLTSMDNPMTLAVAMAAIYSKRGNHNIKVATMQAHAGLVKISEVRQLVEERRWVAALDCLSNLSILPIKMGGRAAEIRQMAAKFTSLPGPVQTIVPNLIMWALTCCSEAKAQYMASQFSGNEGARNQLIDEMKQTNMDLTTYTSQLRYRFPAHLHDALARAQSDY